MKCRDKNTRLLEAITVVGFSLGLYLSYLTVGEIYFDDAGEIAMPFLAEDRWNFFKPPTAVVFLVATVIMQTFFTMLVIDIIVLVVTKRYSPSVRILIFESRPRWMQRVLKLVY